MTAALFNRANIKAIVGRVAGEMGHPGLIGAAEDSRLDQPSRVVWVPVERTRMIRECTTLYSDGVVYYERSNQWDVHLRGMDEAATETLETLLFNALVTLGMTMPAVEISEGDIRPGSVAAEQGCLIVWRLRIWEPIYYSRYVQAHIETATIGVEVNDASNSIPGA